MENLSWTGCEENSSLLPSSFSGELSSTLNLTHSIFGILNPCLLSKFTWKRKGPFWNLSWIFAWIFVEFWSLWKKWKQCLTYQMSVQMSSIIREEMFADILVWISCFLVRKIDLLVTTRNSIPNPFTLQTLYTLTN